MDTHGRGRALLQIYHHAVLPRDVPGHEDKNLHYAESELIERLTDAVKFFTPHAPLDDQSRIDTIRLALSTCKALNVDGKIDKHLLVRELQQLGTNQVLILHVTEQNAALTIHRQSR